MLYNIFLDISQSNFLCSGTNKFDAVKMAAVLSSFHNMKTKSDYDMLAANSL